METTTPTSQPTTRTRRNSSHSRTRMPSRPTTPLRPPSRTSLRASQTTPSGSGSAHATNGDAHLSSLEPAFAELSDSMADLEANFMHLQLLNESIGRFNENFGAFLYGMNMSAFCVDFPEAPIPQSFARASNNPPTHYQPHAQPSPYRNPRSPAAAADPEATFLTNDTSFVENPPTSGKPASKFSAPPSARGDRQSGLPGRGAVRGRAGSGIARGTGRGGAAGGSRVARGVGRGRARGTAGTRG